MNKCETGDEDGLRMVRVTGEVDMSWSQDLRREILDALSKAPAIGVDLSAVSYMDSSGIAALVEGFQQSRSAKKRFALIAPSDSVRSVLELARLDRVFPIFDNAAAARSG
jgi:anti-sigma B factor antagonist